MTANQMNMPAPSFPRVGSSLSYVSYPGQAGSPGPSRHSVKMPRAYSYAGISPYHDAGRDVIYSIPDVAHSEPEGFDFNKQGADSPVASNNGSTSSQEDLEMRASRAPAVQQSTSVGTAHRLHPSNRSRRTSDASLDRRARTNSANHKTGPSTSSRDSRPPPSTRGFSYIPSSASPLPIQVGTMPQPLPVDAIAPDAQEPQPQFSAAASRQNSTSSLPGLTPTSTGLPSPAAPASPSALGSPPANLFLSSPVDTGRDLHSSQFAGIEENREVEHPPKGRTSRFTERTSSLTPAERPVSKAPSAIVNYLPEPAQPVADDAASMRSSKSKGRKLQKGKGRLVKKSRRSAVEVSA